MRFQRVFLVIAILQSMISVMALAEPPMALEGPADLVIENAKVFLPGTNHTALALKSNRILAVGTKGEIEALVGPNTMRLDAKGCSVTPGIHDAHVHFLSGSVGLSQIDLSDANSIEAIEEKIRSYADLHPNQPWLIGRGWVYGTFREGLPSKALLDRIVPDRPAAMKCYDGHTLWVNSRALQVANITKATPNPEGGVIVHDPVTDEPTGVLKENALKLMDGVIPKLTLSEKLSAVRMGITEAHRLGVTSVLDAGVVRADLEVYETLQRAGELSLRFTFALNGRRNMSESDANQMTAMQREFPDLNIPAIKLVVDGVIESHTAVLLSQYANRLSLGLPETSKEDLERIVEMLDRRGWQIIVHAIGDGGIRMTLDAFERAKRMNPGPTSPRRHRIEHIESISSSDVHRFGILGVVASMQPYHADPNSNIFEIWATNLGSERASRAWVWKSIQDAGGQLAFGSDWPVVGLDPRLGIHTALTRQTLQGEPAAGFIPEQRLSLEAVLDAYTRGSAFAEHAEVEKGTLAAGLLADIVVWDKDLFALPENEVHTAKVQTTIFDGRIIYQTSE